MAALPQLQHVSKTARRVYLFPTVTTCEACQGDGCARFYYTDWDSGACMMDVDYGEPCYDCKGSGRVLQ